MGKELVRIADMKIGKSPTVMVTYGVGSCVVIGIVDTEKKIGGLLHFVLPEYSGKKPPKNPFRYGDISMKQMIKKLIEQGADKNKMVAKIAGGSLMFPDLLKNPDGSIGKRNIDIAKKILKEEGIKIGGEDTGGDYGRSIEFDIESGVMKIHSYKGGDKEI